MSVSDNEVTYTPAANYAGTDSFGYSMSDGTTVVSAVVNVTVNEVNDAPVAADDLADHGRGHARDHRCPGQRLGYR